jgi:hypothetical protein
MRVFGLRVSGFEAGFLRAPDLLNLAERHP